MARKSKQTPQTIKIILEAIASGLNQREAATLAGISEDTLSLWKGNNSDFSEQIRQKEIELKRYHIDIIKEAAKKSWQAAAWWLERKHKEEFSNKNKLDIQMTESLDELGKNIRDILTVKHGVKH